MSLTAVLSILAVTAVSAACQPHVGSPVAASLEIVVESDPGVMLSGVPIRIDGKLFGRTDHSGRLRIDVRGSSGQTIGVLPECPQQPRAEPTGSKVRLRRYGSSEAPHLRIRLECRPLARVAVFVVRARNGPKIPISVDGEVVATTNELGVAHFARSAPAGTELLVELDASGRADLLPRAAKKLAKLPDSDELFVIDQPFEPTSARKKPRSYRRRITKIE